MTKAIVITASLEESYIKRIDQITRHLRERDGESISRSEVIRRAIDCLFLSERLIDKPNGEPVSEAA